LQQLGAVAVKQAVYALPDSPAAREDFEWLKTEIESAGGQATVFAADTIDTWSDDALIEEFRRSREEAYTSLAREAERMIRRFSTRRRQAGAPQRRAVQQIRQRLAAIEQVDFFGSAGRDRVVGLVQHIEQRAGVAGSEIASAAAAIGSYQGRLWVTRPRPGVDRMASAWLLRRFVDQRATFGFVSDRDLAPAESIPFDMVGVEFTHRGDRCTFEVLVETFALAEPAILNLAEIVHDLDLKDARYGAAAAPAIGLVIDGLRLAYADDQALLVQGIVLFDALYRGFTQRRRPGKPTAVAKGRAR
jgi:hypothetical protein